MSTVEHATLNAIREHRLLEPGVPRVLAVSGGLDSMVLLDLFARLPGQDRATLVVAHFNHKLRGAESDADARFVRAQATARGLTFVGGAGRVADVARRQRLSLEMAARVQRHRFLAKTALAHNKAVVLLAHTADDQVEQLFLRLFRASGLRPLGGMRWKSPSPANRNIQLARPFLGIPKAALRAYADQHQVPFRVDSSNLHPDPLRNRIRLQLIPWLQESYGAGALTNLPRVMDLLAASGDFIEQEARRWIGRQPDKPGFPPWPELHLALQREILRQQLLDLGLDPTHDAIELARTQPGKKLSVSPGRWVVQRAGELSLVGPTPEPVWRTTETLFTVPERSLQRTFAGGILKLRLIPRPAPPIGKGESAGTRSCWLDPALVGKQVRLRHWRPGDRFQPEGRRSASKLQDLFTNAKVPAAERHRLVVAELVNGPILWVEGFRPMVGARADAAATRVLEWVWTPKKA